MCTLWQSDNSGILRYLLSIWSVRKAELKGCAKSKLLRNEPNSTLSEGAGCRVSTAFRTLGVNVESVQGLAAGHEEAVALDAAEAEVGRALREPDVADGLARR